MCQTNSYVCLLCIYSVFDLCATYYVCVSSRLHATPPPGKDASILPSFHLDLHSASLYIACIKTTDVNEFGMWSLKLSTTEAYDLRVIGLADVSMRYRIYGSLASSQFGHTHIRAKPVAGSLQCG